MSEEPLNIDDKVLRAGFIETSTYRKQVFSINSKHLDFILTESNSKR